MAFHLKWIVISFIKGGAMYRGFVVRKYTQGQQIEVVVDVIKFWKNRWFLFAIILTSFNTESENKVYI